MWIKALVILTIAKYHCLFVIQSSRSLRYTKIIPFIPSLSDIISNVNNLAIVTSSICELLAIVKSHWSIILTLYLWTLSWLQRHCQPGRFSLVAHLHDLCGIYHCVFSFSGRIEIDHSYGVRWSGLCCHSWHSTHGSARRRLAPFVLCWEWQHKPLQRRPYRGQFL